ncbi:hypothetical protein EV426DRAFT_709666 [Tirmania nivea]|nr:hypothetical protein EV426DRAFT_709666 [Tirmania nivea]
MCGLCEEGVAQNAVHLLRCPGVADGKGRKWEEIWEDPEWCEKLAEAVQRELRTRFGGRVLDTQALKEMYEERQRADAKKQEKQKSQVGVKGKQKGKKVVQFDDTHEENLEVEEINAEE